MPMATKDDHHGWWHQNRAMAYELLCKTLQRRHSWPFCPTTKGVANRLMGNSPPLERKQNRHSRRNRWTVIEPRTLMYLYFEFCEWVLAISDYYRCYTLPRNIYWWDHLSSRLWLRLILKSILSNPNPSLQLSEKSFDKTKFFSFHGRLQVERLLVYCEKYCPLNNLMSVTSYGTDN